MSQVSYKLCPNCHGRSYMVPNDPHDETAVVQAICIGCGFIYNQRFEVGDLRIFWIRNVPNSALHTTVADLPEALSVYGRHIYDDLRDPSVESNVGGLEIFDDGWLDWELRDLDEVETGDFEVVFDNFIDALRTTDQPLVPEAVR
jgi:hypothetical protein